MEAGGKRLLARAYGRFIDRPGSMAERCRISLFEDAVLVEETDGGRLLLAVPVERVISLGRYAQEAGGAKERPEYKLPGWGFGGDGDGEPGIGNNLDPILGRFLLGTLMEKGPAILQLRYWSDEGGYEGMFFGEPRFGMIGWKFKTLMKKRRRAEG